MRKNLSVIAMILAVVGIVLVITIAHATASPNTGAVGISNSPTAIQKYPPTYPSYTTTNKQVTPSPYITSCPGPLPTPQVINIALGHGDPTYHFVNEAIVVSNGKGWYVMGGSFISNPNQGVIVLDPISTDPCRDFTNHMNGTPYPTKSVFLMPSMHGSITISAVSNTGTIVSFQSADGTAGHFDFVAKTFAP